MDKSVLLVNDDQTFLFIAEKMLLKSGICGKVDIAQNGETAITFLDEIAKEGSIPSPNGPAYIFLDLHMPVMDGWGFLELFSRKYAAYFPHTHIIIISSTVDPEKLKSIEEYEHVSGILDMPMTMDKLREIKNRFSEQSLKV